MPKKKTTKKKKLNSYYIDFNSVTVVAEDEDKAYDKVVKMIKDNPLDYAMDFEVNLNEEDVEDDD